VLGEGQILAQVKQVYKVGQTCVGFGRHLNGLFKQVRRPASINSGHGADRTEFWHWGHVCVGGGVAVLHSDGVTAAMTAMERGYGCNDGDGEES